MGFSCYDEYELGKITWSSFPTQGIPFSAYTDGQKDLRIIALWTEREENRHKL